MKSLILTAALMLLGANAMALDTSRCPEKLNLTFTGVKRLAQPDATIAGNADLLREWEALKDTRMLHYDLELVSFDKRADKCEYEGGGQRSLLYSAWGAEDTLVLGHIRARVVSYSKSGLTLARDRDSRAVRANYFACESGDCGIITHPIGFYEDVQ